VFQNDTFNGRPSFFQWTAILFVSNKSVRTPADVHNAISRAQESGRRDLVMRVKMSAQPVDATQALNLSAGVSNVKVLRGRSLS
jgi:hypothetical protein